VVVYVPHRAKIDHRVNQHGSLMERMRQKLLKTLGFGRPKERIWCAFFFDQALVQEHDMI
jgi:hypothetical protein